MRLSIGFLVCLAVGMVLSLIGAAAAVVLELHELVADRTDMDYVRPMVLFAFAFAIACAVSRAYITRRRSAHRRVTSA